MAIGNEISMLGDSMIDIRVFWVGNLLEGSEGLGVGCPKVGTAFSQVFALGQIG
jgi:hypothetical protein